MSQRYIGGLIYNPPGGFSGYFDGSGDYLDAGTNAAFAVGTGNFTIELWVLPTAFSGTYTGYFTTRTGGQGFDIQILNSSATLMLGNNSGAVISANNVVVLNTWQHICAVRSGTTNSLYVNGVRVATGTDSTNFTDNGAKVGSSGPSGGNNGTGYISNVRLVKGTAVYDPTQTTITVPVGPLQAITNTSLLTCAYPTFRDGSTNNSTITVNGSTAVSTQNPFPLTQLPNPALGNQGNGVYSMSQYQALRSQNLWPAIDPYFDFVTLMLHGNGTNGAQNNTFLDSSTNNFTITRNGNTTQGTFTPYGSNWANYFDGSTAWLNSAASASLALSGNFTVEFWLYYTGTATNLTPGILTDSGTGAISTFELNNGSTYLQIAGISATNTVNRTTLTGGAIGPNQWYHLAFVRNSNVITAYINGVAVPTTMTNSVTTGQLVQVGNGRSAVPSVSFLGYLSNYRIVSSAVYTSNFTPSTAPLTAITGTQMLTCQSNRFIDNSSNNFTITRNGDVSVQRFSPFNPTTPYAAGTIGGSGYFDGSGDYLTTASNAAMAVGTGDFTLECWVYATATPSDVGIYEGRDAASSNGITLTALDATTIRIFSGSALVTASGVNYIGTWCHLAVTRVSGTTTLYINGVSAGTSATSYNGTRNTAVIGAGVYSSSPTPNKFFPGYISNFRLVKGTAVYTGNFTPPASPVAAVTNTSLLLNFTNGGIIDNAMMSDFETVGNTQVSTTQFKFGGSSIYFDGSGDYLFTPISPNLNMGTSDWTIEMWVYISSRTTNFPLVFGNNRGVYTTDAVALTTSNADSASYNDKFVFAWNNGGFSSPSAGTSQLLVANVTNATATWYHFAVVRNGTSIRMYRNGTEIASATISAASTFNWGFNGTLLGGGNWDGAQSEFNGYLDDVRVTRGYARYTGNFTPQRSQWQDQ